MAGGLLIFAAAALLVAGYLIASHILNASSEIADEVDWSGDTRLAEVLGGEATRETGGGACRAKAGRLGDAQTDAIARHGKRSTS